MEQASRFLWMCYLLAAKLVSTELCKCQAVGADSDTSMEDANKFSHSIRLHFSSGQFLR